MLDVEIEVAVAERSGITSMRQTVGDESTYTVVKGDVAYVFDMLSPYYMRVSTADLELELTADDNTRFVAEGREAIDGKTYDFVIRESLEDSTQHLTYFFDGDTLFAIRATLQMDSVTMNVLFHVTAFTDEIPEDMPFEVPQGYTEYVEEPYEAPEFPSELPEFTVGTLYSVSTSAAQCGFVYIFTERTDCDAYIEALKADGFRPVEWKESGVFAAKQGRHSGDGFVCGRRHGDRLHPAVRRLSGRAGRLPERPAGVHRRDAVSCGYGGRRRHFRLSANHAGRLRRLYPPAHRSGLCPAGG